MLNQKFRDKKTFWKEKDKNEIMYGVWFKFINKKNHGNGTKLTLRLTTTIDNIKLLLKSIEARYSTKSLQVRAELLGLGDCSFYELNKFRSVFLDLGIFQSPGIAPEGGHAPLELHAGVTRSSLRFFNHSIDA